MKIISNPTRDEIKKAAKALKDGHLVAFPTETVYGLGADATNEKAVSRIYSVKNRPTGHPLIVHFSSLNQLDKWAIEIPLFAMKLARQFWPGPMTLILKRGSIAKDFVTGDQNNIGLRVPAEPVALALLSEFEKLGGIGVAAPSANRFGAISPTSANDVQEELGNFLSSKDLILDGGRSEIGIESTIIDCTDNTPKILRPGFISLQMIEETCGIKSKQGLDTSTVKSSGQFASHYAPLAEIFLDKTVGVGDGFLAMANVATPDGAIRLGTPTTASEFASILYAALRQADQQGIKRISVIQPHGPGIALAIRDRLGKAACR